MKGPNEAFVRWWYYLLDVIPTDVRFMIPSLFRWYYQEKLQNKFDRHILYSSIDEHNNLSYLYQHKGLGVQESPEADVVLFLHGDYAHPCATMHLAEMAQKQGKTIFSLYVPFREIKAGRYQQHIRLALKKIHQLLKEQQKTLRGLLLIGHSRGATEAAYQAYVEKQPEITAVITIAGRLKPVERSPLPCSESLKPMVDKIYQAIGDPKKPIKPALYQIVASSDACVDPASSSVRDENRLEVDTGHTRVLYHSETLQQLVSWLEKAGRAK